MECRKRGYRPVRLCWVMVGALILAANTPEVGIAQDTDIVSDALDCFEQSRRDGKRYSECAPGVVRVEVLISSRDRFDASIYEEVRDGLERLALSSDDRTVRISAVHWLARPGHKLDPADPTAEAGIVNRLSALYSQANQVDVRRSIIALMEYQAEKAEAIGFLTFVAESSESSGGHFPAPYLAATTLAKMGPEGQAVLQDLHASGTGGERVQRYLDRIAEKNYRSSP